MVSAVASDHHSNVFGFPSPRDPTTSVFPLHSPSASRPCNEHLFTGEPCIRTTGSAGPRSTLSLTLHPRSARLSVLLRFSVRTCTSLLICAEQCFHRRHLLHLQRSPETDVREIFSPLSMIMASIEEEVVIAGKVVLKLNLEDGGKEREGRAGAHTASILARRKCRAGSWIDRGAAMDG